MSPRQPVTARRLLIVMAPTVAACAAVGVAVGPRYPFAALLFTAGILCMSSAALPAPAWSWWLRVAGKALRAAPRRKPAAPEPEDPAEHALWVDRLRLVAQLQRDSGQSHPEDCFCACGIPVRDLERFRDQIELIAWQMQQRDRGRGQ